MPTSIANARGWSSPVETARSPARAATGSIRASVVATTRAGSSRIAVPLSPTARTAGVNRTGASAKPAVPPSANRLRPLAARSPAAAVALRAASG